jgi:hypothetical protein
MDEWIAWLKGQRSCVNWMLDGTNESNVNAARYDAAMTEQAYWAVRAHREGLVGDD